MQNAIVAALLIIALSLMAITSGLIKTAFADSVIGNPIPVGSGPYKDAFDPDNGNIYVANTFSSSVSVINGSTNKLMTDIPVHSGQTPRDLAYDSADQKMFVADVYSNTVSVINTT